MARLLIGGEEHCVLSILGALVQRFQKLDQVIYVRLLKMMAPSPLGSYLQLGASMSDLRMLSHLCKQLVAVWLLHLTTKIALNWDDR